MGIIKNDFYELRIYVKSLIGAVGIAALVGGCVGTCSVFNNVEYSSGSRVGVINKISERGLFWKTDEGQMALEGLIGGKTTSANVWDFSIDNQTRHGEDKEGLIKSVNDALNSGEKVKIKYIQASLPVYWRGKTDYYIQSVEPLSKPENK